MPTFIFVFSVRGGCNRLPPKATTSFMTYFVLFTFAKAKVKVIWFDILVSYFGLSV